MEGLMIEAAQADSRVSKSGLPYHKDFSEAIPERYQKILDRIRETDRVLEVGCHTGFFSASIRRKSRGVVGIELNERAAAIARQCMDDVIVGDAGQDTTWAQLTDSFDCILFMDVLEHLYDPSVALRCAREFLPEGGRVLATLPNVACWNVVKELVRGRFVPPSTGLSDFTHIRWYTIPEAVQLFEECGFTVVSASALWTCVPFEHQLRRLGPLARLWHATWVARFPNLSIAVPLIEAVVA
jgi:SAM-dependent methyltransferase